jgi:hypothetical protein
MLERALVLARQLPGESDRAYALGPLVERIAQLGDISRALDEASHLTAEPTRMQTALCLAYYPSWLQEKLKAEGKSDREPIIATGEVTPHVLERLAHFLPAPSVEAALAQVGAISSLGSRSRVAASLAIRLVELGQAEWAAKVAAGVDDPLQRFRVYLELKRFNDAESEADKIAAPLSRANALVALASHVAAERAPELVHRSVETVQTVASPDRDSYLPGFTRALASFGFPRQAVDLTSLATGEVKRVQLLVRLLPKLPAGMLAEIVEQSKTWQNEPLRTLVEAFAALQATPSSTAWVPGVSALLLDMEPGVHGEQAEVRDTAGDLLLLLFERLAVASQLPFALELAQTIEDNRVRARVLRLLAGHLGELAPSERTRLWPVMIHKSAARQRRDLLSDLTNLSPLIYKLGNPALFTQAVEDVTAACRWWA